MAKPDIFSGPIPGESLTTEPGNVPWEQPAKFADPMDALDYYLKQLTDVTVTDNVIDMMDLGVPVDIVADTMLSTGIMNGIHSVDVKLVLKPVLFMQLKALADVAEIDYKETMQDYEDKDEVARIKRMNRIAAKLQVQSKLGGGKPMTDRGDQLEAEVAEMMQEGETAEAPQEEMNQGLMSKETM